MWSSIITVIFQMIGVFIQNYSNDSEMKKSYITFVSKMIRNGTIKPQSLRKEYQDLLPPDLKPKEAT